MRMPSSAQDSNGSSPSSSRSRLSARKSPASKRATRRNSESAKQLEESASSRIIAAFSSEALKKNYLRIQSQVPSLSVLPMIKANAYGHGAAWAARVLYQMPGLHALGVATLQEGKEIREALGSSGRKVAIHVFSGVAPWSDEKGQFCEKYGLTPVIFSMEDWRRFLRQEWPKRIPYELKFNTGMNRLGISPDRAESIRRQLKRRPQEWLPKGVLSHLAMAESPLSRNSRMQLENFKTIRSVFSGSFSGIQYHLANSSAIWNQKAFELEELTDLVRPGISLYGVPPWPGAPNRGLTSVVRLRAKIIQTRHLRPGEALGYGATYQVKKGRAPVKVAILSAGYGDGLHRMCSNGGEVWVKNRRGTFLGIISMDLSAVTCPKGVKPGDWVEILGTKVDFWKQAQKAGTIPYELLTSLSGRVERKYE